ncbi:MAG: response regulator transcription factor [Lachnospiraceae bacterium]|nr:response regulator transcription factor [Lachnospiraceae bacterium]
MIRILIVEDDAVLADGLKKALQSEYEVTTAGTLGEACVCLEQWDYQLLILDINLPDGDGVQFCKAFKQKKDTPVMLLTARDTEQDEITGLEAGADEYITKPFRLGILRARIRLLLRKKQGVRAYEFGELALDFEKKEYRKAEKKLTLSRTEEQVLYLLVSHAGQTLTRDYLIENTWDSYESVEENTLSVCITRLKAKIGAGYIGTVYGIGYQWQRGGET